MKNFKSILTDIMNDFKNKTAFIECSELLPEIVRSQWINKLCFHLLVFTFLIVCGIYFKYIYIILFAMIYSIIVIVNSLYIWYQLFHTENIFAAKGYCIEMTTTKIFWGLNGNSYCTVTFESPETNDIYQCFVSVRTGKKIKEGTYIEVYFDYRKMIIEQNCLRICNYIFFIC